MSSGPSLSRVPPLPPPRLRLGALHVCFSMEARDGQERGCAALWSLSGSPPWFLGHPTSDALGVSQKERVYVKPIYLEQQQGRALKRLGLVQGERVLHGILPLLVQQGHVGAVVQQHLCGVSGVGLSVSDEWLLTGRV